jgi:putative tricarboxylic transport membrane protein
MATSLLLWGVVAGLVVFTRGLPFVQEGAPGPRFMPVLVAIFLSILNVLYSAQILAGRGGDEIRFPALSELTRPAGFVLLGVLMVLLWERLGVVATVLVASIVELKWLEEMSWIRSILVGALLSLGTWLLFQRLLGVPLPTGVLEWLALLKTCGSGVV